jgi:hypothetical protein
VRFIAAIVSFVIAFGLIAYGIAQRTVLAEPNSVTASAVLTTDATVTVIDSKTLKSLDGRQNVDISGSDKVFAAYGRTEDVLAWVGDASYNKIGYNAQKIRLTNKLVKGTQTEVPNPQGSDLWLGEYSRAGALNFTVNVPDDISIVIVSDGKKPAPSDVSIRWPLDNRTPWSGPLIVGGFLFLLIGIALYLWAFIHMRRARGPRRKSPKMPKVPRQRSYKAPKPRAVSAPAGRRSNRRRMVAVAPMVLIGALALSGCSADLWPDFITGASTPTSTPTATAAKAPAGADVQPPAVTVPQLKHIISRISAVAAKADASIDPELAKTRFTGAALDLRTANYAIRKVDSTYQPEKPIPSEKIDVTLPQSTDKWPRTVFTVVSNPSDKTVPPVALTLVQAKPRDDYKVAYATALEANTVLPQMAPANVGATRLPPDNKLLVMAPSALALAYGDILEKGPDSPYAKQFDTSKDALIALIGLDARKKLQAALPATAAMTFANSVGPDESIALGSNDSGAIVAVYLNETVTVKPVEAGAAVNPEGAVKSLSGITGSTKGTTAVYGDQLLFYVPPISSKDKVVLLGFATGLISAKELP